MGKKAFVLQAAQQIYVSVMAKLLFVFIVTTNEKRRLSQGFEFKYVVKDLFKLKNNQLFQVTGLCDILY